MKQFECVQLRNLVESITSGSSASQTSEGVDTVPVTRIESLGDGFLKPENLGYVAREDISNEHRMHKGDILFSNINSLSMIGKCVRVRTNDLPVFVGMNTLRIRPNRRLVDDNYLFWAIYSDFVKGQARAYAKPAINQASLPQSSIKALQIPHPPLEEQRAIADFLDRETAEIDAFIADQERLIELLTERRTATITHAVEGLFREDSYPTRLNTQLWESDARRGEEDLPLYSVSINHGVVPWVQLFDKEPRADDLSHYRKAGRGDIVLNRMRAFQGGVGIAPEDCCVSPDYAVLKSRGALSSELIVRMLKSERGLHEIRKRLRGIGDESNGAVRTPRINVKDLLDIRVQLPSRKDQAQIVAAQDDSLEEVDTLLADAKKAIELSKERRAALISAAVTGQIDVRTHAYRTTHTQ